MHRLVCLDLGFPALSKRGRNSGGITVLSLLPGSLSCPNFPLLLSWQVAVKNNIDVFYFSCLIPLNVLFVEDGKMGKYFLLSFCQIDLCPSSEGQAECSPRSTSYFEVEKNEGIIATSCGIGQQLQLRFDP